MISVSFLNSAMPVFGQFDFLIGKIYRVFWIGDWFMENFTFPLLIYDTYTFIYWGIIQNRLYR
jgi:hypothetical protein